jgi:hypothetical protein
MTRQTVATRRARLPLRISRSGGGRRRSSRLYRTPSRWSGYLRSTGTRPCRTVRFFAVYTPEAMCPESIIGTFQLPFQLLDCLNTCVKTVLCQSSRIPTPTSDAVEIVSSLPEYTRGRRGELPAILVFIVQVEVETPRSEHFSSHHRSARHTRQSRRRRLLPGQLETFADPFDYRVGQFVAFLVKRFDSRVTDPLNRGGCPRSPSTPQRGDRAE